MNMTPKTRVALVSALVVVAAIAGIRQDDVQAEITDAATACSTGNGHNALTIALPKGSTKHIDGVYIRRAGCAQWSDNLGAIAPGKSLNIFNLDDGDIEVFWRERPDAFGSQPTVTNAAPSDAEWTSATSRKGMSLSGEAHRRIVVP